MESIVEKAREYAIKCHKEVNQYYDNKPYTYHLENVVDVAKKFIHLIPEPENRENVLAACWVHDVIEDCRQTYNDVKKATNEKVAEIAYALTNEKGKTRAERANDKYYEDIINTPLATYVKVCDRIANYAYSISEDSGMKEKYYNENVFFIQKLFNSCYKEMFDYLKYLDTYVINKDDPFKSEVKIIDYSNIESSNRLDEKIILKLNGNKQKSGLNTPDMYHGKPTLGLTPRDIHYRNLDIDRFDNVCAAIMRYVEAKLVVPKEWYDEYNYLLQNITK